MSDFYDRDGDLPPGSFNWHKGHEPVLQDIAIERLRQIGAEGWTSEHDDAHSSGEMATAAACYSMMRPEYSSPLNGLARQLWPWSIEWWKPSNRRRNLVKAGALIVAEIERIDRTAVKTQ